jgi:hypothetical protein
MAEVIAAVERNDGNRTAAAKELGMNAATVIRAMRDAMLPAEKPFEVEELPSELPTAAELLTRRSREFTRKKDAHEARKLINVNVRVDGPIGLALVGDPHLDDPGTDIDLLQSNIGLMQKNDALLPLGIGDYSNNWVGRLARLYGEQSVSQQEAWLLVEWLVRSLDWLALVAGNHDCWSGSGDPIKWMAKAARVNYEAHGIRLGLNLPCGRTIRLNARHDFKGKSQYNTAHGISKAATSGWRDHILTAGHTHVSGIQVVRDPMSGLISHCLRIGSYKTFDRYADELGLPNQTFTVCPVVVVRPQFPDDDNRLLTTFFEPETAALFLRWLRGRKSERA